MSELYSVSSVKIKELGLQYEKEMPNLLKGIGKSVFRSKIQYIAKNSTECYAYPN
ncbi:MAG: hypothetical protein SO170_05535 [Butyribacter sp.]|nr:hypothetical protein [bacterium]MDY3854412.1 hypothetical protein [Butyribacter sp.]